jgi:hypothetical protein
MKTVLLAVAVAVPALAFADDPKPYVLVNGQHVNAAGAARPAKKSAGPHARSFAAGGAKRAPRGSGAQRGFAGTRAASSGGTGASGGTSPANNAPPPYAQPGSVILSAGQQPTVSDPGKPGVNPAAANVIALDASKAQDVDRAPSVHLGPPDRAAAGGAGGNGATSNSPGGFDPSF